MTDCLVADELKELVLEVVHRDSAREIEEWNLTRIEFGILSWHLGNFYCCPCGETLDGLPCCANHDRLGRSNRMNWSKVELLPVVVGR